LFGEERQDGVWDVALDERCDEHRKKYGAVVRGDIDEIPQSRYVAIWGRKWHRSCQLGAKKTHRRSVGDLPPTLADANNLAVRPAGVDVDRPFVVGNAQVYAFWWLCGRQPLEDQRGVGERLASGDGAGLSEVAGGEVGA
jgi:hypothetical protein